MFKTTPAADEKVAPGSMVQIVISKGPKPVEQPKEDNETSEGDASDTNGEDDDSSENE